MILHSFRFQCPKRGSSDEENEDALAVSPDGSRCAIADGATTTSFSRHWAKALAEAYIAGEVRPTSLDEDLLPLQRAWHAHVASLPLPWHAQVKVGDGAFAALLGVTIVREPQARWEAFAVGDCCLFHFGADHQYLGSFPVTHLDELRRDPLLISSNRERNGGLDGAGAATTKGGDIAVGERLVLATDALAAYILEYLVEDGDGLPSRPLPDFADDPAFRQWVEARRDAGEMRNDDVTLITLCLEDAPADGPRNEGA